MHSVSLVNGIYVWILSRHNKWHCFPPSERPVMLSLVVHKGDLSTVGVVLFLWAGVKGGSWVRCWLVGWLGG